MSASTIGSTWGSSSRTVTFVPRAAKRSPRTTLARLAEVSMPGRLGEALGREQAGNEPGAAHGALPHDRGPRAQLGGAYGGDVTAGPAADHGDVKSLGHDSSFRWRYSRE